VTLIALPAGLDYELKHISEQSSLQRVLTGMEYDDWEPVYAAILDDFGFDRAGDERARDRLAAMLDGQETFDLDGLDVDGQHVAVAGAGDTLEAETAVARAADLVFAASTAADRLLAEGVPVDCIVTDLDKHPETVVRRTGEGVPVAVHAHGDNVDLIERYVPECDPAWLIPTTQAAPVGPVHNPGGFTDGDRAAFLADHLGARSLAFLGWDFDDDTVDPMKARKLDWAQRLLYWLERRREERFSILEGRRGAIDTTALPVY